MPIDDIHWLEGRWGYKDDYNDFYIDISIAGKDSIDGKLCCVTQQGRKIDCADDEPNMHGLLKTVPSRRILTRHSAESLFPVGYRFIKRQKTK